MTLFRTGQSISKYIGFSTYDACSWMNHPVTQKDETELYHKLYIHLHNRIFCGIVMSVAERVKLMRWAQYLQIEDEIGRGCRISLDKLRYATTYEEVERIVKNYGKFIKEILDDVRRKFPEYYSQARKTAKTWYDRLKFDAREKIKEIAEKRLKRM